MPDSTDLDTSDSRAPAPGYVPLASIGPDDTVETLTKKFEPIIQQVGDAVIMDALSTGDTATLNDQDALTRKIGAGIEYEVPNDASKEFVGRLETAVNQAMASQIEFLYFKALGASVSAALGASDATSLGIGSAFAVFSEIAVTSLRGLLPSADPITLFSGELVHAVTDARINGAGIDFEFIRTYRSLSIYNGPLGASWDHSYNLWLRVTGDEQSIACGTGGAREEIYARHEIHQYWVPPDGVDAVIVREGDSFVRRTSDGSRHIYARDDTVTFMHRIARMEDRFGNYLAFAYADGHLRGVEVNHPARTVAVETDELGRITAIRDYAGRIWRYGYDSWGDLIAVTTPVTTEHPKGLTTSYEYSSDESPTNAQHKLTRIVDPSGATYLANVYGTEPGTLAFNRVVAQRQGGGETLFDYSDVIQEFDVEYSDLERPAHETVVTNRNGHPVRHVFNRFGNLLLHEEYVVVHGLPTPLRLHCRYNRDGNLAAMLTPEGVMTQYVYGRDQFVRANDIVDASQLVHDSRLTPEERQAFNRPLAVVRRARTFRLADLDLSRQVWGDVFPDVFAAHEPADGGVGDIVTKFTYESAYGQLLTISDPRFTDSPDPTKQSPSAGENVRYEDTLTRYVYEGPPADPTRHLAAIIQPTPIAADGTPTGQLIESFRTPGGVPAYDERGRLLRRTDAAGTATTYQYVLEQPADARSGHLREVVVDPGGLDITTTFEVDVLGRVVATTLPRGAGATDGSFVTRVVYDELDQAIESIAPAPFLHHTRRSYAPTGMLRRVERDLEDPDGNPIAGGVEVRTFHYDEELRLVRETVGGSDLSRHLVLRHCYDAAGRLVVTIEPAGSQVRYAYDPRQLPVKETRGAGGPDVSTRRIEYDGDGRVRRGTDARGEATTYTLDVFGRLLVTENALGHVTRTSYDKAGNVTCVRHFERRPEGYFLLARSETDYDELHRVVRNGVNRFEDPVGPFAQKDLPDAALDSPGPGRLLVTAMFYDAGGRVARTVDPLGRETAYRYDAAGRRAATVDAMGNETRYRYDTDGNIVRLDRVELVQDPISLATIGQRVFATASSYDELDRVATHTDPLGNVTRYAYDSRGLASARIDPLGNRVKLEHDVFGRRVVVRQELTATGVGGSPIERTSTTTFEYDANGNAVALIDALGRRTEQQFDLLNRRRVVTHVDGSLTQFDYDADDNFVGITERNGVRRRMTVDPLNRVTRVDVDLSEVAPGLAVQGETFATFTYDGMDRCVRAENDFATCEYVYNSLGCAVTEAVTYTTQVAPFASAVTLHREFDDIGVVIGTTYPGGRLLALQRDPLGRLTLVRNVANGSDYPGDGVTPTAYDIARMTYVGGQRASCTYGNGAATRFAYDSGGRVVEVAHVGAPGPLVTLQYAHDGTGCTRLSHDTAPGLDEAERYFYDSLYQLRRQAGASVAIFDSASLAPSGDVPGDPIPNRQSELDQLIGSLADTDPGATFEYDLAGNRIRERQTGGQIVDSPVNALDEYTHRDGAALRYDPNGNLVDDGARRYVYDAGDRLVRIEDSASSAPLARYYHDARGRRVLELEAGGATHLFHDAANVIAEYRNGALFASYVYDDGIDRPLQIATGGVEAWYHSDSIGSVRMLTDRAGEPLSHYRYTPFGVERENTGTLHNPLRFCARRRCTIADTYDFRARQYDPSLGRFLQPDPAGLVDSTNPYTYAINSPLSRVDPWGTDTRPEVNRHALESYFDEERKELAREFVRRSGNVGANEVFTMYGYILDEIEKSALEGRPMDLNGLWEKGHNWDFNGHRLNWTWMCGQCQEHPPLDKTGPFHTRDILGVSVPDVFRAVTEYAKPNPSWGERLFAETTKAVILFGPGFLEGGALRGAAETSMVRAGLGAQTFRAISELDAGAALAAEAAGGERIWLVGPEGASTTRGLRFVGNRISYDTFAPGQIIKVRQDMGAIQNYLGLRGDGFLRQGDWFTGTHGMPEGAFGGEHLEYRFVRTDRQVGPHYNWNVKNVYGKDPAQILSGGLERPTVYAWCYSTNSFLSKLRLGGP